MKKVLKENKYFLIGFTAFLVFACSILFYFLLFKFKDVCNIITSIISIFTPFIIGFAIAFLLNPVVKFFNRFFKEKVFKKCSDKSINIISVTITIILTVGVLVLLFSFIIPEFLKSIEIVASNLPNYINDAKEFLLEKIDNTSLKSVVSNNYDSINDYLNTLVNTKLLPKVDEWLVVLSNGIFGAFKVIFNIFVGFVMATYFLLDKNGFIGGLKKTLYSIFPVNKANKIVVNGRYTNEIFGEFLIGKLLDALTIGLITFIFLTIFGFPYPLLIGVIIGLTNMIPYFGPFIGTIPSALLILTESPAKCFIFVLFIIAIQQIDSYIIEPKLCGSRTGLKSFWVLASILIFGSIFGILGMILGVPLFALIYGYIAHKCDEKLKAKNLPITSDTYTNIDEIDPESNKTILKKDK